MKTPILPSPPFSNFNQTPPLLFLLPSFFDGVPDCSRSVCYFLLNDLMYLHVLSLSTPVLEGPFGLLNAARCQLTEVLSYYSDLISHTQTKTCNTHRGQQTDTPIYQYRYILTPPAMGSQHLSALHRKNNLLTLKIQFTEFIKAHTSKYI